MKIAITADVHLAPGRPERLQNLELIIKNLKKSSIRKIIIAGDLFDKGFNGYRDFDNLVFQYPDMDIHIIPGNHDEDIHQRFFSCTNITVYTEPAIVEFGNIPFLFLPYKGGETMGRVIEGADIAGRLDKNKWVLISHGDFGGKRKAESGNEDGYFPLTRADLMLYGPATALLGHIHRHHRIEEKVIYPGSPYPLDITETGQRGVILYDTDRMSDHFATIPFTPVNLIADLFIVPDGREREQIAQRLEDIFKNERQGYEGDNFFANLTMRVNVRGYTTSREGMEEFVRGFLIDRGITAESVSIAAGISDDQGLNDLGRRSAEKIATLFLNYENSVELKRRAIIEAYRMIYGGEGV